MGMRSHLFSDKQSLPCQILLLSRTLSWPIADISLHGADREAQTIWPGFSVDSPAPWELCRMSAGHKVSFTVTGSAEDTRRTDIEACCWRERPWPEGFSKTLRVQKFGVISVSYAWACLPREGVLIGNMDLLASTFVFDRCLPLCGWWNALLHLLVLGEHPRFVEFDIISWDLALRVKEHELCLRHFTVVLMQWFGAQFCSLFPLQIPLQAFNLTSNEQTRPTESGRMHALQSQGECAFSNMIQPSG